MPPTVVILRGEHRVLDEWSARLVEMPFAHCMVVAIPSGVETGFPSLDKKSGAPVNAWVCKGVECLAVIETWEALHQVLQPMQDPANSI